MDVNGDDILNAAEQRPSFPVAPKPTSRSRSRSTAVRATAEVGVPHEAIGVPLQVVVHRETSPPRKGHRSEGALRQLTKATAPPTSPSPAVRPPPLTASHWMRPTGSPLLAVARSVVVGADHVCVTLLGGSRHFGLTQAATLRKTFERHDACSGDHDHVSSNRVVIVVSDHSSTEQLMQALRCLVSDAEARYAVGSPSHLAQARLCGHVHLLKLLDQQQHSNNVLFTTPWWATEVAQRLVAAVSVDKPEFQLPKLEVMHTQPLPAAKPASSAAREHGESAVDGWSVCDTTAVRATGDVIGSASVHEGPTATTANTFVEGESTAVGNARDDALSTGAGFLPVFFRDNNDRLGLTATARAATRHATTDSSFAGSSAAPTWAAANGDIVGSANAEAVSSPFLGKPQQRQLAYIDSRKPFACQQEAPDPGVPPARSTDGPNAALVAELERLCQVYKATGDKWREYAYSKAITQIKKMSTPITNVDELSEQRGFGERIRNKIREILETGSTAKLRFLEASTEVQALQNLTKIWGVGPSTARKLLQSFGTSSVEALRGNPAALETLSSAQRVGLQFYEDLQVRLPRSEVEAIEAVVCDALRSLRHRVTRPDVEEQTLPSADVRNFNQACDAMTRATSGLGGASTPSSVLPGGGSRPRSCVDVVTCGSYRRGKPTSGDVDILLCNRGSVATEGLLAMVVDRLATDARQAKGFTVFELLTNGMRSHSEQSHSDTWFGVVQIPPCRDPQACPCEHKEDGTHYARRLDIKLYPASQYAFAIMYFTGSDYFNRSMRLYAQKKGLSLSDKELRPVIRVHGDKVHEGLGIECKTERDIFVALGLPYKTPAQRDIN